MAAACLDRRRRPHRQPIPVPSVDATKAGEAHGKPTVWRHRQHRPLDRRARRHGPRLRGRPRAPRCATRLIDALAAGDAPAANSARCSRRPGGRTPGRAFPTSTCGSIRTRHRSPTWRGCGASMNPKPRSMSPARTTPRPRRRRDRPSRGNNHAASDANPRSRLSRNRYHPPIAGRNHGLPEYSRWKLLGVERARLVGHAGDLASSPGTCRSSPHRCHCSPADSACRPAGPCAAAHPA